MKNVKGKRIFVGLSGGVDSAVSAALLQEAGGDVTGVFIKGWYPPGMPCTWAEDRRDAMRVAAHLGIPFHTLDASEEYKKGVIDYLLSEYAAGRTPNPDVMCNREVKFGAFYAFAKEHGANFIATGHYSRVQRSGKAGEQTLARSATLLRGLDPAKDQSYFLWAVPQEALAHTLFPVGGLPKSDVRKIAEKYELPVAEKKDSQGICFLGSISVDEFLRQEFGTHPGDVFDTEGNHIGSHDGAVLHTLGERIPLHLVGKDIFPGPWYVVAKDMQKNTLTVSKEHLHPTAINEIPLREANWFEEAGEISVEAQYRYHGPLVKGSIDTVRNIFTPSEDFPEPLALGQSLVLYTGDTCIGGGIIA